MYHNPILFLKTFLVNDLSMLLNNQIYLTILILLDTSPNSSVFFSLYHEYGKMATLITLSFIVNIYEIIRSIPKLANILIISGNIHILLSSFLTYFII